MLLDLEGTRTWLDLLPVASEMTWRQLDLASRQCESGARLLAAPEEYVAADPSALIPSLSELCEWLIVDGWSRGLARASGLFDGAIIVTTPDPPALRGAVRTIEALKEIEIGSVSFILNQWSRAHPLSPSRIAASLSAPLLATLPFAPRAVADQVQLGRPIVNRPESSYAKNLERVAADLLGESDRKVFANGRQAGGSS